MVDELRFRYLRLKIHGLLMQTSKTSHPELNRTLPTLFSIALSTGPVKVPFFFNPDTCDQRSLARLTEFIEGLYSLSWIEVLSIMGATRSWGPIYHYYPSESTAMYYSVSGSLAGQYCCYIQSAVSSSVLQILTVKCATIKETSWQAML